MLSKDEIIDKTKTFLAERAGRTVSNGGFAGAGSVIIFGLLGSLFGVALGVSCSAQVPGTDINIGISGAVGKSGLIEKAVPQYIVDGKRLNLEIKSSNRLNIGDAAGETTWFVTKQVVVPAIDLKVILASEE